MTTLTLSSTRAATAPGPAASPAISPRARRDRRSGVALVAGGTLTVALAMAGVPLVASLSSDNPPAQEPASTVAPPVGAMTLTGPEAVTVVSQQYEPGQDSGWHTHPGIHAVAVVAGTLTVFDDTCQRLTFEPGRPYVGGQRLHLARNETGSPVEMVVTYMTPQTPADSTGRHGAPACWSESTGR